MKNASRHRLFGGWPWMTFLLIGLQVLVLLWEHRAYHVGLLNAVFLDFAFRWSDFVQSPVPYAPTLLSHLFLHGNNSHFLSNAVFLLLFGPAVEKRLGRLFYLSGYILWGVVGALTQGVFSPFANGLIGASGAISGAAGAFFVLYPLRCPPQFVGYILGSWIQKIPAFFWIGLYFLDQLRLGFGVLTPHPWGGDVASIGYWAHIGGFLTGALTVIPVIFSKKR